MPRAVGESDEEGSTLILIIFSSGLALALILGIGAATSLYLERKRLFTIADGAALAASESFDLAAVTAEGTEGLVIPALTNSGVTLAAQEYISSLDVDHLDGLELRRSVTTDGRSATVELTSYWRPPVVSLFFPDGMRLDVEATARSVFF